MSRVCTICHHPKRKEIEEAITDGISYRHIASQFSIGYKSVERHIAEHIQQAIKQSEEAKEKARGLDVVEQLQNINTVTLAILKEARDEKKNGMALFAIDRVQKQLELQAKLLGDINDAPQVNIILTPEWRSIRTTIVQALVPFPDARIAVADALERVESARARLN